MRERCRKFLLRWAKPKYLWAGLAVLLLFNFVLFPAFPQWMGIKQTPLVLDLRMSYNIRDVREFFEALGPKGLRVYRLSELLIDVPYMIFYSFYYAVLLLYFLKRKHYNLPFLVVCLPFVLGIYDLLENIGIIYLTHTYPELNSLRVAIVSGFTTTKWTMALMTFLTLLLIWIKPAKRDA